MTSRCWKNWPGTGRLGQRGSFCVQLGPCGYRNYMEQTSSGPSACKWVVWCIVDQVTRRKLAVLTLGSTDLLQASGGGLDSVVLGERERGYSQVPGWAPVCWNSLNEKLASIRFQFAGGKVQSAVVCYGPNCKLADNLAFLESLGGALEGWPSWKKFFSEISMLSCVLTEKLGGAWLEGTGNLVWTRTVLCYWTCTSHGLVITNTIFEHKWAHKCNWYLTILGQRSMIDFIVVSFTRQSFRFTNLSTLTVVTERIKSEIQAAEMMFPQWVAGLSLINRVRSSDIRRELGPELLLLAVERSQLMWYRHMIRMPLCSGHVYLSMSLYVYFYLG